MSEAVLPKLAVVARRQGVLVRAYGSAVRHLIRLAAPAVAIFVPVNALLLIGLGPAADESLGTADGTIMLLDTPGRGLIVWLMAVILLGLTGQLVTLAATVVIAAGLLAHRAVPASAAVGAAFRRLPALVGLGLLGLAALTAVLVAGFLVLSWAGGFASYVLFGTAVVVGMPAVPAVAVVMLEGQGPLRAVARAYRLTRMGRAGSVFWPSTLTLALGVLVLPVAAQRAMQWALPENGNVLVVGVATSLLAMIVPAFQAMVITRLYVSLREDAEPEDLPGGGTASRAWPVPVLLGLALPGLLWGATLQVNPFGWLETSRMEVTAEEYDGGPRLWASDLAAAIPGQGGRLTLLLEGYGERAALLTCGGDGCGGLRWAEPADADPEVVSAAARMHDGRVVVSTWLQDGRKDEEEEYERLVRLGLMVCDATACKPAYGPIGEKVPRYVDRAVALVPDDRHDALMIVEARELSTRSREYNEVITVTVCGDMTCAEPRTKELARLPSSPMSAVRGGLVAGEDTMGLPVVLRFDKFKNVLTLITCEPPGCVKVHQRRLVESGWTWLHSGVEGQAGAAMVVRKDGRPLIAYRDAADGSVRMLDCRTLDCTESDSVILSGPSRFGMTPALALTGDGRALVAYVDGDDDQVMVASCAGTQCVHAPVAPEGTWAGDAVTLTLDDQGRPVVGWSDTSGSRWNPVLTTVHNLL